MCAKIIHFKLVEFEIHAVISTLGFFSSCPMIQCIGKSALTLFLTTHGHMDADTDFDTSPSCLCYSRLLDSYSDPKNAHALGGFIRISGSWNAETLFTFHMFS